MTIDISGVLPGPTGSLLGDRKFQERFHLPSSENEVVFGSENGLRALKEIAAQYQAAGATIGTSSTFRLTDLRLAGSTEKKDWKPKRERRGASSLGREYLQWNRNAVEVAKNVYGKNGLPIVGLVAPTTSTSKSDDDRFYTALSKSEQVELCLLYTSPSPRDATLSRMPSSA